MTTRIHQYVKLAILNMALLNYRPIGHNPTYKDRLKICIK